MPILGEEDLRKLEVLIGRGGEFFNPGHHGGLGTEQFGAEVVDYREYDYNEDDASAIDPYMTALMCGEPWVREYAPDRLRRATLVVDQKSGMQAGNKLCAAHEIAYALGYALKRQGDLAALHISGSTQLGTEMSRSNDMPDEFARLLQKAPLAERSTLADGIRIIASNELHQDMVFVISDLMSSGWRDAVGLLAEEHFDVVMVQVLHPNDVQMQSNGRFAWRGNGSRISSSVTSVQERWTAAAGAYQADVRSLLGSREFGHIVINPTQPTVSQLIKAFTNQEVYA